MCLTRGMAPMMSSVRKLFILSNEHLIAYNFILFIEHLQLLILHSLLVLNFNHQYDQNKIDQF
jgi:hypothetical protein